ncbi:hypothetical protein IWZ00DRAFT_488883 [Phyllosticta capitalensis]
MIFLGVTIIIFFIGTIGAVFFARWVRRKEAKKPDLVKTQRQQEREASAEEVESYRRMVMAQDWRPKVSNAGDAFLVPISPYLSAAPYTIDSLVDRCVDACAPPALLFARITRLWVIWYLDTPRQIENAVQNRTTRKRWQWEDQRQLLSQRLTRAVTDELCQLRQCEMRPKLECQLGLGAGGGTATRIVRKDIVSYSSWNTASSKKTSMDVENVIQDDNGATHYATDHACPFRQGSQCDHSGEDGGSFPAIRYLVRNILAPT